MSNLSKKKCVPCRGGIPKLTELQAKKYLKDLDDWQLVNDHHIEKEYKFSDFSRALNFVNLIGELAEIENHHPDLALSWGKVVVSIWTHKIDGLHENDFILAAKIDQL